MASLTKVKPQKKRSSIFNPLASSYEDDGTRKPSLFNVNIMTSRKKGVFEDPELDDVLENNLPEPFTRENFYIFLKNQMAEESLEFYEHVQELRLYLHQKQSPNSSINVVDLDKKIEAKVDQIINQYVDHDSQGMINISGKTRSDVISEVKSAEDKTQIDVSVFDAALQEIKRLLNGDPFFAFISKTKNHNLSKRVSSIRLLYGMLFYFIGCALVVAFVVMDELEVAAILENPFWKLLSFPFFFIGSFNVLSGTKQFCPRLCTLEKYQNCPHCNLADVWLGKKNPDCKLKHKVEYQGLMAYFKARAWETWKQILIISVILTLIATFLTPGTFY